MDLGKILGDLIVAGQAALNAGMQQVSITCAADGVEFTLTLYPAGQGQGIHQTASQRAPDAARQPQTTTPVHQSRR